MVLTIMKEKYNIKNLLMAMENSFSKLKMIADMPAPTFLENESCFTSANSTLDDFLNKLYQLSERVAYKKMEKEGMVHGTIEDILAYFEIITNEEKNSLNKFFNIQRSVKKEDFQEILKKYLNFLSNLYNKLKKMI